MQRNRFWSLVLAVTLVLGICPLRASAAAYKVVSTAAIVMDADTGEVLYKKNANKALYPASITKVLTGLIAAEALDGDEVLQVGAAAVRIPKGYAHLALMAGDTITAADAMYALMLASANDAANVLADHIAGSRAAFAGEMNAYAEKLGARGSNFVNPHGMPSSKHYTTAYDMALITSAAAGNSRFMQYFGAVSHTLPSFNRQTREIEITNYQFMLDPEKDEYYPDAIGGKIGYTREAGHTMCTVAQRDGRTLVCVVLESTREGKYKDTQVLLDHCFRL